MDHPFSLYVGVDWGIVDHQVCVATPDGKPNAERLFHHSGASLAEMGDWLTQKAQGNPASVAVAIETPRGPIVEMLLERGFQVFSINPKQLDRFRDRHTVAGAKDDRRDARVLADSLRTDRKSFRQVKADDPTIMQLRELSRAHEELREELVRLTNRLREQLHRFFPQVLELSAAADEPWVWELLALCPTPAKARSLRPHQVQQLLKARRVRRFKPSEVVAVLAKKPLQLAPGTVEAVSSRIELLLPRLHLLEKQIKECEQRIGKLLKQMASEEATEGDRVEHRDVRVLLSLPGVGIHNAATMLAEASGPLRQRDYHSLRAQAGVAPVTHQSGKRRVVGMRRACNPRLRDACYHWGRVSIQRDEWSRAYYDALRSRGHSHGRALRSVVDRWLRVLMAMLKSGTLYEPAKITPKPDTKTIQGAA